ncbi:MAG TPA: MBL fold metallo-hydrolase [Kiritimatiellia bacterium]|nr:MBL fold metallo-hydrolase [Kiritimatiellia bacterium]HQQ04723.1 MBL fold metallo-hydrolase [Kiritimatiellia bacterium]
MKNEVLSLGPYEANCYFIWDANNDALVIDPGYDGDQVSRTIENYRLNVRAWLLTHGHADHVSGLAAAHAKHPAPVYIHEGDASWVFSPDNHILPYYAAPKKHDGELTIISETQQMEIGSFQLQAIHTPGHSPGGVCYYFPKESLLFSGDTLFKGSAGRTDLRGGDSRALAHSLKLITELPDYTAVYPGHGDRTSLRLEKRSNYFLRQFIAQDGRP